MDTLKVKTQHKIINATMIKYPHDSQTTGLGLGEDVWYFN